MRFAKGHGTQNDFVLLPDPDARLALSPAAVSALCDRHRGLGADGVLRVITAEGAQRLGVFDRLPEGVSPDDWYMDYRNADGSIAEMCGNGVRVFAHYLRASGLEDRDRFVVGSLAGPRPVTAPAGPAGRAAARSRSACRGPWRTSFAQDTCRHTRSVSSTRPPRAPSSQVIRWSRRNHDRCLRT